jgi:nucleoside-diphosphate-sugar epimerase
MVHVDDLARAYLLAALSGLRGEAFDIVDDTQFTVMEMASAAAQTTGRVSQLEFIPLHVAEQEMGTYAEALALDQVVDASKTKRLLGWQPKHKGFIPEVETYYKAWQASQSAKEYSYGTFYL